MPNMVDLNLDVDLSQICPFRSSDLIVAGMRISQNYDADAKQKLEQICEDVLGHLQNDESLNEAIEQESGKKLVAFQSGSEEYRTLVKHHVEETFTLLVQRIQEDLGFEPEEAWALVFHALNDF